MEEEALATIPAAPGTYLLGIAFPVAAWIDVGRLGRFFLPAGWYGYAGSARGSGGLRARLARHQRLEKRLHWHVDHILASGTLRAVWWAESPMRLECVWADAVRRLPGVQVPVPGFGSSDCHCQAHLAYLEQEPAPERVTQTLALASAANQCFPSSSEEIEVTVRCTSSPLRAHAASTSR